MTPRVSRLVSVTKNDHFAQRRSVVTPRVSRLVSVTKNDHFAQRRSVVTPRVSRLVSVTKNDHFAQRRSVVTPRVSRLVSLTKNDHFAQRTFSFQRSVEAACLSHDVIPGFSWFSPKIYPPELYPGPMIQSRSAARRAA